MTMKIGAPASKASAYQKNAKSNEHSSQLTVQMSALPREKTTYELSRPESSPLSHGAKSVAWLTERVSSWIAEEISATKG